MKRIGADVGGTFTDLILVDEEAGLRSGDRRIRGVSARDRVSRVTTRARKELRPCDAAFGSQDDQVARGSAEALRAGLGD